MRTRSLWLADKDADLEQEGETSPLLQNVHFFATDGKDMGVLWEVQPAFVIVYNPDISFVRQLEVSSALLLMSQGCDGTKIRNRSACNGKNRDLPDIPTITDSLAAPNC